MNFFHNRIANPVTGGMPFNEWLEQQMTKTARGAKPGTGLDTEDEPRGQQRGQVINNDNDEGAGQSYQDGESVDGKKEQGGNARPDKGGTTEQKDNKQKDKEAKTITKTKIAACSACGGTGKTDGGPCEKCNGKKTAGTKTAVCGKEMGECADAGKVTEDHTEAGPGDDEHPEPKVLINNDPNYQKGESTDQSKAKGTSKKQPGEPVVSKSSTTKAAFKKIAAMNRKEKLTLFANLSANRRNLLSKTSKFGPLAYCEAMVGLKFANLTPEEKEWFKNFWEILYPPEYVKEMVTDR